MLFAHFFGSLAAFMLQKLMLRTGIAHWGCSDLALQLPPEILVIVLQHMLSDPVHQLLQTQYNSLPFVHDYPPDCMRHPAATQVPTPSEACNHLRQQLETVQRLRLVCRTWCYAVRYSSMRQLCLRHVVVATPYLSTAAFSLQFAGCQELYLESLGLPEVPSALRSMPSVTCLSLARNPLGSLPLWFSTLPLQVLNLAGPDWQVHGNYARPAPNNLSKWLADPSSRLPPTLRCLCLCSQPLQGIPHCVRGLQQLHTLDLGLLLGLGSIMDSSAFPVWFQELSPHLRDLRIPQVCVTHIPDSVGNMPLNCLQMNVYQGYQGGLALAKLCQLVHGTALGGSLRELVLDCWDLPEVPQCLRGLRCLRLLSVQFWVELYHLPDWLAELPLEILGLVSTSMSKLPASFSGCATLREVHIMATPFCDFYSKDDRLDWGKVVNNLHQTLALISTAQPKMRFQVSDLENEDGCVAWWDAASGLVINGERHRPESPSPAHPVSCPSQGGQGAAL